MPRAATMTSTINHVIRDGSMANAIGQARRAFHRSFGPPKPDNVHRRCMPRAASMTSTIKVATGAFSQLATGEFKPNTVNWSSLVGVACRVFPATEREIRNIWGEALQVDAIAWVLPGTVSLPAQVLTGGSGVAVPVQVTDASGHVVQYMAVRARDMANMNKLTAIALRRFTHG